MMCFEDYEIGNSMIIGSHQFTADEIKRFAASFDPQPFHLDEDAAAAGPFGGIAASGWHTASIWMRLMVDAMHREATQIRAKGDDVYPPGPSPGFDDMRWLKPVFAGDTLTYSAEVSKKVESQSRPQWGIVSHHNKAVNQRGDTVFTFISNVFVPKRKGAPAKDIEWAHSG